MIDKAFANLPTPRGKVRFLKSFMPGDLVLGNRIVIAPLTRTCGILFERIYDKSSA